MAEMALAQCWSVAAKVSRRVWTVGRTPLCLSSLRHWQSRESRLGGGEDAREEKVSVA